MLLNFHIKGINYIKCKTVLNFIWPAYDNSDNKLNIQVWHWKWQFICNYNAYIFEPNCKKWMILHIGSVLDI